MIARRKVLVPEEELKQFLSGLTDKSMDDHSITMFEEALAEYVGVKHVITVSSGRLAMSFILKALKVQPGDEIIVPAYTLGALVNILRSLELKPVLADIDEKTLTISASSISARLTEKTKAIIVLHTFGNPCDMDEIVPLAQNAGIPIVEDCAHSLGAVIGEKQTGSYGRAGFFSFETTKPVNTFGGGAVTTNDDDLAKQVRKLALQTDSDGFAAVLAKTKAIERERMLFRTGLAYIPLSLLTMQTTRAFVETAYRFFQPPPPKSIPYLPQQAKLGLSSLKSLEKRIEHRSLLANLYREHLPNEISSQLIKENRKTTWYFFLALLNKPAFPIRRRLLWHSIDCAVEKEIADDCTAMVSGYDCPVTKDLYRRAIVLPMYDDLTEQEVMEVSQALKEVL